MQIPFNTIAIIGKYMNPVALANMQQDLVQLVHYLHGKHYQIIIEAQTAQHAKLTGYQIAPLDKISELADLAIVMGGDGTMLSVARSLVDGDVPLIGINRGRFGFLTDLRAEDMLVKLDQMLAGEFIQEPRMLLVAELIRNGQVHFVSDALNDVVIKSNLRLIELEVKVDQKFVYKQRSDGLIVSTPTGTTAYALSAGGPILHPNLEVMTLVPICPHTLSNRPITVHSNSKMEITVVQFDEAHISFDGQFQAPLMLGDVVQIRRAEKMITLLHPKDYCYFEMLRNKLNWG